MHGATSAELKGPQECLFSLWMLSVPVFSEILGPPNEMMKVRGMCVNHRRTCFALQTRWIFWVDFAEVDFTLQLPRCIGWFARFNTKRYAHLSDISFVASFFFVC